MGSSDSQHNNSQKAASKYEKVGPALDKERD